MIPLDDDSEDLTNNIENTPENRGAFTHEMSREIRADGYGVVTVSELTLENIERNRSSGDWQSRAPSTALRDSAEENAPCHRDEHHAGSEPEPQTSMTQSRVTATPEPNAPPSGDVRPDVDRCRCGAKRHASDPERCVKGHPWRGNSLALVAGARSVAFWREHEREREDIAKGVIAAKGHTVNNAPLPLRLAADALAMAVLVQRSAFVRVVEAGGPLSGADRTRRCYRVWESATDRVTALLRLVGLERVERDVLNMSADEWARRNDEK